MKQNMNVMVSNYKLLTGNDSTPDEIRNIVSNIL